MSPNKSRNVKKMLIKEKEIKTVNILCVCLFVGRITRTSSSSASSWEWSSNLSKTIDLPRVLSHLQLEIPSQPNKLLMLLYNGLKN